MSADEDRKPAVQAEDHSQRSSESSSTGAPAELGRRELLKALGATGALVSAQMVLPRSWTSPVVDVGVLPAHAETSATFPDLCSAEAKLSVKREDSGAVTLTWSGIGGASVTIYRRWSAGEDGDKRMARVDAPVSSYTDFTVEKNQYYYYSVCGDCTVTTPEPV